MTNTNILEIISKKLAGEASPDEILVLEGWKNESNDNQLIYNEYAAIWDASANYKQIDFEPKVASAFQNHLDLLYREEQTRVIELAKETPSRISTPRTSIISFRMISRVAAIMVFVLASFFIFQNLTNTSISAPEGVRFATLEDGTNIWLDQGSSLNYKNGFGKSHRNIELKGKAFFDVERNENLVFSIQADKMNVAVLGTSFMVDTKTSDAVSVVSGQVSVLAGKEEVILEANQKAELEKDGFIMNSLSSEDVLWRNRKLSFENAPIQQVIADINLFHNNKIQLASDLNKIDCPFTTGGLEHASFNEIIEILKLTYDLKVEELTDGVRLSIMNCN